ncbi:MAG: hypothetical protein CSA96_09970 [Bacteroidetes bacterium]|nr:MAG: hypothetical protein CSA96_09970 [Bacteroidota bacterium]
MSSHLSENEVIAGIKRHDVRILESIYRKHYPIIEAFVLHNNGSREEARDVFQEAMIIIYNKSRAGALELRCRFGTYLYAVCKKIWMQERRKYSLHLDLLKKKPLVVHDSGPEQDLLLQKYARKLFDKHFAALSPDCQQILQMYFNELSVEQIRAAMNYKNQHHAADRKYRCKKSLIKRIMNDPLFERIQNEQR